MASTVLSLAMTVTLELLEIPETLSILNLTLLFVSRLISSRAALNGVSLISTVIFSLRRLRVALAALDSWPRAGLTLASQAAQTPSTMTLPRRRRILSLLSGMELAPRSFADILPGLVAVSNPLVPLKRA